MYGLFSISHQLYFHGLHSAEKLKELHATDRSQQVGPIGFCKAVLTHTPFLSHCLDVGAVLYIFYIFIYLKKLSQCFLRTPLVVNDILLLWSTNLEVQLSFHITKWQSKAVFSPNYFLTQLLSSPKYLLLSNNVYRNNMHTCQFSSFFFYLGSFFYQVSLLCPKMDGHRDILNMWKNQQN